MPSSTSSFDPAAHAAALRRRSGRDWLRVWLTVLVLVLLALAALEGYWRSRCYRPMVLDSKALWSAQRARVDRVAHPLVLLGASRTAYGVDPQVIRTLLPGYTPIMLAINGHHPLAILRDLAADSAFGGVVLVDTDATGLSKPIWDNSQPWVDFYHHVFSPSLAVHRRLLSFYQAHALIANPQFGALAGLRHALEGSQPEVPPIRFRADRSGGVDYRMVDAAAMRKHFEARARQALKTFVPPDPDTWLADLVTVNGWVRAIQARGGTVIFYQPTAEGEVRRVGDLVYPRARYWDRFAASTPAHALMLRDVPAVADLRLPDGSHVDMHDRAAYTRGIINALLQRGWIPRQAAAGKTLAQGDAR